MSPLSWARLFELCLNCLLDTPPVLMDVLKNPNTPLRTFIQNGPPAFHWRQLESARLESVLNDPAFPQISELIQHAGFSPVYQQTGRVFSHEFIFDLKNASDETAAGDRSSSGSGSSIWTSGNISDGS
eukprot:Filipodium_phascolosomae@DN3892_c0_g1_i1.p1